MDAYDVSQGTRSEENQTGFRVVSPGKGDTYSGTKNRYHSIVFMLDGKVEFSYDNFLKRQFSKGDLFFIPQATSMFGVALEDSKMLVLTSDCYIDSMCGAGSLPDYTEFIKHLDYDFRPVVMTEIIWEFALIMERYIELGIMDDTLHTIKIKELFLVLSHCYTLEQITLLFYPALGAEDFKAMVLEKYNNNISLTEIAALFNMSAITFSRKFKRIFGTTFRSWVLKQKARQIMLRLSMPGVTTTDIIIEFGFANQSYFYNFCREQYGCTATELISRIRTKRHEI